MTFSCPVNKPDKALELARDETFKFLDYLVDEGYNPDGITVSTTIKRVGNSFVIEIK